MEAKGKEVEQGTETGTQEQAAEAVTVPREEFESLQQRAGERDEYLALAKRTQADFENYQKRMQQQRSEERRYIAGSVLKEILPVLDNLERAIAAAEQGGDIDALLKGIKMVHAQFLQILEKQGVTVIPTEGQPFDPSLHEALTQQPSEEHPANTIIHTETTGYRIHDRVLRPAKVVVSSGPAESEAASEQSN